MKEQAIQFLINGRSKILIGRLVQRAIRSPVKGREFNNEGE